MAYAVCPPTNSCSAPQNYWSDFSFKILWRAILTNFPAVKNSRRSGSNACTATTVAFACEPLSALDGPTREALRGELRNLLSSLSEPGAVPGWILEPGAVRRSIADPIKAFEQLVELFSVQEFLACSTPSVSDLERAWSRKTGQPAARAKESFKRSLGDLLVEKRNAPSLKPI
jgi:hypothetical protein